MKNSQTQIENPDNTDNRIKIDEMKQNEKTQKGN